MHQQAVASATRISFQTIVGTHYFFYFSFLYQGFERNQISFMQVTWFYIFGIEFVPVPFRSRVNGKVLGASVYLIVFPVFVQALQAFYNIYAHNACQIRVFTVCFLTASPTRVTEYIDIRCPEC